MGRPHLLSLLPVFAALIQAEDFPYRRESMEHVLYEELAWFDKYLKQPD